MWQAIKPVILWNFNRTSWQYEVLCALIIAFIFLTPPAWYAGKERTVQTVDNARIIVSPEIFSPISSESERLELVRGLSGNKSVERYDLSERRDREGKIIAYEITIR